MEALAEKEPEPGQVIIEEALKCLQAFTWYDFNVHKDIIIDEIYGKDHHENYLEEKMDLLNKRGMLWVYGQLDDFHRVRVITAMYARYRSDTDKKYPEKGTECPDQEF